MTQKVPHRPYKDPAKTLMNMAPGIMNTCTARHDPSSSSVSFAGVPASGRLENSQGSHAIVYVPFRMNKACRLHHIGCLLLDAFSLCDHFCTIEPVITLQQCISTQNPRSHEDSSKQHGRASMLQSRTHLATTTS